MDPTLPLELRNTANELIRVLDQVKASTPQQDFFVRIDGDPQYAAQRFLHQLAKIPGGSGECERRAALMRTPSKLPLGQAVQSAWSDVRGDIERERFRLKRWVSDQTAGTRGREPGLSPNRRSRKIERAIAAQRSLKQLTDFGRQILNLPDESFDEMSVFNLRRTIDHAHHVVKCDVAHDVKARVQALHDAAMAMCHEAEDLAAEGCMILQKLRARTELPFNKNEMEFAKEAVASLCDWASRVGRPEPGRPAGRNPKRKAKRLVQRERRIRDQKVREAVNGAGMSRKDAAAVHGITPGHVTRILRNDAQCQRKRLP